MGIKRFNYSSLVKIDFKTNSKFHFGLRAERIQMATLSQLQTNSPHTLTQRELALFCVLGVGIQFDVFECKDDFRPHTARMMRRESFYFDLIRIIWIFLATHNKYIRKKIKKTNLIFKNYK